MPVMWWPRFETNVLLGFTRRCRHSETSRRAYAVTLSVYTRRSGRTLSRMLGLRVLDWALAMMATTTCPPRFNRPNTGPFPAAARPRLPLRTPLHAHSSASTSPPPTTHNSAACWQSTGAPPGNNREIAVWACTPTNSAAARAVVPATKGSSRFPCCRPLIRLRL